MNDHIEVKPIEDREADASKFMDQMHAEENLAFTMGTVTVDETQAVERAAQAEAQRIRDGDVTLAVAEGEIDDMATHAISSIDDARAAFDPDADEAEFGDPDEDEDDCNQYSCPCGH